MKANKPQKPTREALQRKIVELESQLVHRYAMHELDKASTDHLMASGIIMQLTVLGGRVIMEPTLIRDGLSKETIAAIKADLSRSYDIATMYKPK